MKEGRRRAPADAGTPLGEREARLALTLKRAFPLRSADPFASLIDAVDRAELAIYGKS